MITMPSNHDAFLSYSHAADRRLAPSLQHAPIRFGKAWYRGQTLRIFRDQTSLSVSPALWALIFLASSVRMVRNHLHATARKLEQGLGEELDCLFSGPEDEWAARLFRLSSAVVLRAQEWSISKNVRISEHRVWWRLLRYSHILVTRASPKCRALHSFQNPNF